MDSVTWEDICSSKALILGLKRYAFRREYTASKLAAVGFTNLELVDAFDGFKDDVDAALAQLDIKVNPTLGKGHKGCCQTHFSAWQQMIDDGVSFRIFLKMMLFRTWIFSALEKLFGKQHQKILTCSIWEA